MHPIYGNAKQSANKFADQYSKALRFYGPLTSTGEEASLPDSRLLWFMQGIMNRLFRCRLYFQITETTISTIQVEVLAVAQVNGEWFSASARTSQMSVGANQNAIGREVEATSQAISKMLGVRVFNGEAKPIPDGALHMFVDPA